MPYDERPLPATRKQPATALEPEKSDWDSSEAPRGAATGEPEPLTEKALREASAAVDVLGEALVTSGPCGWARVTGRDEGGKAPTALCLRCPWLPVVLVVRLKPSDNY